MTRETEAEWLARTEREYAMAEEPDVPEDEGPDDGDILVAGSWSDIAGLPLTYHGRVLPRGVPVAVQHHRIVLAGDEVTDDGLRALMERDGFWPDVWDVSDHGDIRPRVL